MRSRCRGGGSGEMLHCGILVSRRFRGLALACLAISAGAGCGDSSSGPGRDDLPDVAVHGADGADDDAGTDSVGADARPGDDTAANRGEAKPSEEFAAAYTEAVCSFAVRCGVMPDQSSCTRWPELKATRDRLVAAMEAGRIRYDPAAGERCFDRYANLPCLNGSPTEPALAGLCERMFEGLVPVGGACFHSRDCDVNGNCRETVPARGCSPAEGICRTYNNPPRPQPGRCRNDRDCTHETFCRLDRGDPASPEGTCEARRRTGEPCLGAECAAGNACIFLIASGATCVAAAADGQPCVADCLTLGSLCIDHVCRPRSKVGEACALLASTPGPSTCWDYLACIGGICRRRPEVGEACSAADGPPCFGGQCVDGVCRVMTCDADAGAGP